MRRAVFLDRDGVINRSIVQNGKPLPPDSWAKLEILPNVGASITRLKRAGFMLIVVTNQPDVSRGVAKKETVEEINSELSAMLEIDDVLTCYHDDQDGCDCRKPLPGSLFLAANKYGINLKLSYMVGDRWKDIEAGRSAGCKTFFIDYEYKEKKPSYTDYVVKSLFEATEIILGINNETN